MNPATRSTERIRLIAGLGNPDPRYAMTYHNAGTLFADYLLKKHPAKVRSREEDGFAYARLPDYTVARLFTYMNESGRALARARAFLKTKTSEILLVHDDSDLPLGTFQLSFGRGGAGHHGVESVIAALRSKEFWRLRIGVRPSRLMGPLGRQKAGLPAEGRRQRPKAGDFVLRAMTAADEKALYRAFDDAITKLIVKERP